MFTKVQILFLATTHKIQMLTWHLFYKVQILIWHLFYKVQILFWQLSLAIFYQKPKYYPWQYFTKSPNTSWAKFYKYSKARVLSLAIFYRKPKYYHWKYFTKVQYYFGNILSTTQNYYFFFFDKWLFRKNPNIIWQIILYYAQKPKVNTLATTYFQKPMIQVHGKTMLSMEFNPMLKAHGSSPWQLLIKAHDKSHGNYLYFTKISWKLSLFH